MAYYVPAACAVTQLVIFGAIGESLNGVEKQVVCRAELRCCGAAIKLAKICN
jgi:hypothetical protein